MRKLKNTSLAAALLLCLTVTATVIAITYGQPDGNRHPNVGALVGTFQSGTFPYCSGTLISPTVFLTAAHCNVGTTVVYVTFDSEYSSHSKLHRGTYYYDPQYNQAQSDPHDIAVVVFDKPVNGITPAQLPTEDSLSNLSGSQLFTSVGYGAYEVTKGPGGRQYLYNDDRTVATGTLNSTNPSWLRISMNPSTGNGGTCYGDSGGPNFLGTTDIIAAITITGDTVCRSTNVVYRLDTESARDFLSQYVTLP